MKNKRKLELIHKIKRFAVDELGIVENPSFEKLGDKEWFYGLYASEKDRIESALDSTHEVCESKKEQQKRKKELEEQGFDVEAVKWEGIGFEDCPITGSLLKKSKTRLSYLILHEQFHIHSKKTGIELEFATEESICNCFAYQSQLLYFKHNPLMRDHINKNFNCDTKFYDFINEYKERLDETYKQGDMARVKSILGQAEIRANKLDLNISNIGNAYFLSRSYYAKMHRPVYTALKDLHPREYVHNKEKLYDRLYGPDGWAYE